MYKLESYEDFKKLVKELESAYKESSDNWEWGTYPDQDKIMYEALKDYIKENFDEGGS